MGFGQSSQEPRSAVPIMPAIVSCYYRRDHGGFHACGCLQSE